tara:strand:- start:28 stop:669 length:642 start_codon:yes stop_codon:yes gene_type:complete
MIGFIGGTGPEGKGLATRYAMAGERVFIGSRDKQKGQDVAASISKSFNKQILGGDNEEAARKGDIVIICVPYEGHSEILNQLKTQLKNKTVIDVVAPLVFGKKAISSPKVEEGSAAEQAQLLLPESQVVGAFHNISAHELLKSDSKICCDVIVCSNFDDSKKSVMQLAEKIDGIRGVDGGVLANAKYVEQLTALLLNINKIYKSHSSIRITGI